MIGAVYLVFSMLGASGSLRRDAALHRAVQCTAGAPGRHACTPPCKQRCQAALRTLRSPRDLIHLLHAAHVHLVVHIQACSGVGMGSGSGGVAWGPLTRAWADARHADSHVMHFLTYFFLCSAPPSHPLTLDVLPVALQHVNEVVHRAVLFKQNLGVVILVLLAGRGRLCVECVWGRRG